MQLKPGTILQNGKYEIIKTLGQGGFGITYLAQHTLMERLVCIKEFFVKEYCDRDEETSQVSLGSKGNAAMMRQYMEKFMKEAKTVAKLEHPHIVKIHDVFKENNTSYAVMEYIDGCSLAEYVREHGPLPEQKAVDYIRQVCDALKYAHARKVMHLDVKPSNIMLSDDTTKATLIDFGMAKQYTDTGEQTSGTPVGVSHGYAPLEQYLEGGVKDFSPATDVYALGATLYFLLTGNRPAQANELALQGGLKRVEGPFSVSVKNAIITAMRFQIEDRPQSIDAFLKILDGEELAEDDEKTVVPDSKPKPKPVSKPKPNPAQPTCSPEKPKSKAWLWALLACAVVATIITAIVLGGRKEKPGVDEPTPPVDTTVIAPTAEQTPSPSQKPEIKPEPVASGSFKVSSTPSGATIWLDGKNTNKTTPEIIEDITPGKHSVKLVLDGYNDYSGSITIVSGKRAELVQALKEKEKPVSFETPVPVETPAPVEKPTPAEKPTTGSINGHDWVDLGLSVKWATCNVGASSPSDYGNYYAWGETKPKSEYAWESYKFRVTGDSWDNVTFNKYNTASDRGTVDNRKKLELADDAARQNWGGSWRMPTDAEWKELREKCTWTWMTQGGKNGYRVTSKTNGNSIFLPAAGDRREDLLDGAGSYGLYWSSSLYTDPCHAWLMYFDSDGVSRIYYYRYGGFSVRPVTE